MDPTCLIRVRRIVALKNHGGFYCHGTKKYMSDGTVRQTLSRAFYCPCGEPFRDGDPYQETDKGPVHTNCLTAGR